MELSGQGVWIGLEAHIPHMAAAVQPELKPELEPELEELRAEQELGPDLVMASAGKPVFTTQCTQPLLSFQCGFTRKNLRHAWQPIGSYSWSCPFSPCGFLKGNLRLIEFATF